MKTEELRRLIHYKLLDFVGWLFRPPGFFFSLWYCFWYHEWPDE